MRDPEISRCATRLRVAARFAMTFQCMTLLSASLACDWWEGLGDYETTIGYAGVALCGLVTGVDCRDFG
ncbi:hypothetical protein [Bradyrhizobium liaoningense]